MNTTHPTATRCIPPALLTQSCEPSPLTTPLQTPFGTPGTTPEHTPGPTPVHTPGTTPGTTPASSREATPDREGEGHPHGNGTAHAKPTIGSTQTRVQARSRGHAAAPSRGATLALHPNTSKARSGTSTLSRVAGGGASTAAVAARQASSQAQAVRAAAGAQAVAAARSGAAAAAAAAAAGAAMAGGAPGGIPMHPAKIPTPSKPFPCPLPLCTKSYKQQNGLKYHLAHGACCYAPRDPAVEALSEGERERVERPWVCAVGSEGLEGEEAKKGCGRRYKNMNGLSELDFFYFGSQMTFFAHRLLCLLSPLLGYHYTHTGAHGAIGLEMLAQAKHPLPEAAAGRGKTQASQVQTLSRAGSQSSLRAQPQVQATQQTSQQGGHQAHQVRSSTPSMGTANGHGNPSGGVSQPPHRGYFPPQRQQLAPPVLSALSSLSAHSSSGLSSGCLSMVGASGHPRSSANNSSAPTPPCGMNATVTVPVPTPVSVGTSAVGQRQRNVGASTAPTHAATQGQHGLGEAQAPGQTALKIRALNHSPAPSPLSPFPSAPWLRDDA